jgi:hypothetical protein
MKLHFAALLAPVALLYACPASAQAVQNAMSVAALARPAEDQALPRIEAKTSMRPLRI